MSVVKLGKNTGIVCREDNFETKKEVAKREREKSLLSFETIHKSSTVAVQLLWRRVLSSAL